MLPSKGSSWRLPVLVALAITLGFAAVIAGLTLSLRNSLRTQILNRELEAIDAVATLQLHIAPTPLRDLGVGDPSADTFDAVLEASRLRGVLAVQLFDADGNFRTSLPIEAIGPATEGLPTLGAERTTRRVSYFPAGHLETLYGRAPATAEAAAVPLLEILIPLKTNETDSRLLGTARFWIDGRALADEFASLDRALLMQAGTALLVSGLLLTGIFWWAFTRVEKAGAQLRLRGADLARANQELAFAAKTAAIGAVSAHLMHEIKNPLSGLEYFVAAESAKLNDPALADNWRLAAEATRRLRDLINQVVGVLRAESLPAAKYVASSAEVVEMAAIRLATTVERTGVKFVTRLGDPVEITARVANLSALILTNVASNALEAAPRKSTVTVTASSTENEATFVISDQGPGLPPEIHDALFQPVASAKPGGSGIGLALSRHLAQQIGGRLELCQTGASGTSFSLTVPRAVSVTAVSATVHST